MRLVAARHEQTERRIYFTIESDGQTHDFSAVLEGDRPSLRFEQSEELDNLLPSAASTHKLIVHIGKLYHNGYLKLPAEI